MKINSLQVFSGITGSLSGSALSATSASRAVTASHADAFSGFIEFPNGLTVTGSLNVVGGTISASNFLGTASYALVAGTGGGGGGPAFPFTGSAGISGSLNVQGPITASQGLVGTASFATTSSTTISSSFATTASYALVAGTGGSGGPAFPFTGSAGISGSLNVIGNQTVTGSVILSSSADTELQVIGNTQITGSLILSSSAPTELQVIGNTDVTGSLGVLGGNLIVSGGVISASNGGAELRIAVSSGNVIYSGLSSQIRFRLSGPGYAWNGITLYPESNNAFDLGVNGNIWRAGYFTNLFTSQSILSTGSITALSGFTGSLLGTASSATLLGDLPSSSFATTGSNRFNGNQVITGSVIMSSSEATELQVIGNTEITGSVIMSGSVGPELQVFGDAFIRNGILGVTDGITSFTASAGDGNATLQTTGTLRFRTSGNGGSFFFNGASLSPGNNNGSDLGSQTIFWNRLWISNLFVSSSIISTGSIQALSGVTGSLLGTASNATSASFATTASYAQTTSGFINFPNGLDVTGSVTATQGFIGTATAAQSLVTTISIVTSASLSPNFTLISSGSSHLLNGVYLVSGRLNDTVFSDQIVSGWLSWYTASVTDNQSEELVLHRIGRTASSASFFMRTVATSGSVFRLEIGSDFTIPSSSYTFNFTKVA